MQETASELKVNFNQALWLKSIVCNIISSSKIHDDIDLSHLYR